MPNKCSLVIFQKLFVLLKIIATLTFGLKNIIGSCTGHATSAYKQVLQLQQCTY